MSNTDQIDNIDHALAARLDPDARLKLASCLQCGRCSSGCTMRLETDILPHQLNRMALLGLEKRLLASRAIWLCASCHTCVSRCPMKVDTPALIDKLRELAQETRQEADLDRVRTFNSLMLKSMRRYGRVFEFGMMGEYKMRTRDFLSDLDKLPTMLRKGKMRLFPPRTRAGKSVARIFDRVHARRSR